MTCRLSKQTKLEIVDLSCMPSRVDGYEEDQVNCRLLVLFLLRERMCICCTAAYS